MARRLDRVTLRIRTLRRPLIRTASAEGSTKPASSLVALFTFAAWTG